MKIALTSFYLPSGSKIGVGYMVHYLANALVERGHDVTVFSACPPCEDAQYTTVTVPCGRRLRALRFAWALRRVDFRGFDVLNAHGDDWFLWGRPLPRHIHTYHGACLAEMCHATSARARIRMAALALCEEASTFLAAERVAVSEATRNWIPRIGSIIPNGFDPAHFSPGCEPKSEHPSILFVGTLLGRKRGAFLVDLFQHKIRPALPDAELWAVCEDPIEGGGVHGLGRVPLERLVALYRRAWVFCLPSTYEGFGVPYLEAMACGTPVVATPNAGAREVTCDGRYGWICPEDELGSALLRVLREPALRQTMREAGLRRAREFTWDAVCTRYESLFQPEAAASPRKQQALP